MKMTILTSDTVTNERLAHARATARTDELHSPVTEKVGPAKLRRWGNRSMMSLLHATHGVYSAPELVAYSEAYAEEFERSHAARVAEHLGTD
jgi:hypothetical protein